MSSVAGSRASLRRDRYPYRLLLFILPLHALKVIQYEVAMAWVRLTQSRRPKQFEGARDLLVNLGCGANGRSGWVNVDGIRAPGVTLVQDCRRCVPLPSGSARAIFAEHVFEHLEYREEAPVFLAECLRVLHPGGTLRLIVPDGRKYLLAYAAGGWDALEAFSPYLAEDRASFSTPMEVVNAHFRQAGQHRFSYDAETLCALFERSGFVAVERRAYGESRVPELAIDTSSRADESLYVEGVKPAS